MKRFAVFFVVLFAFFLCISALAAEKEIIYNLNVEPRSIDPILSEAVDSQNVITNIFEGLVRVNTDDRPEPGCAEKWEISDDGLKITFHLRDGLKWQDGTPLTAEDFRYGFMRGMNAENGAPYAQYTFFIKNAENFYNEKAKPEDVGLKVIDDKTLVIELEYRFPLALDYLTFATFLPARKDIVEKNPRSWATSPETIMSNGPFYLADWKHNSELTIRKNPHYWDAANVKIDAVRMVMINDMNTALAAFKTGRVDFIKHIPMALAPRLVASGEAKILHLLGTGFYEFNLNRKPLDDVRVRKALSLVIDRKAIVEKVMQGGQKPAGAYIPDGIPGRAPDQDFRQGSKDFISELPDVETAKKLLAEAGYPDGKDFPNLTYSYNGNAENKAIAEALQAMWKQHLGVHIELNAMEWKVFLDLRNQKDFDLARNTYLVDFFDASSLLELWITGRSENSASYSNAEYDKLMSESLKELDVAKRAELMQKAEEILMNDMPIAPIFYAAIPYMESKRVKGIYQSPRAWDSLRTAEIVEVK